MGWLGFHFPTNTCFLLFLPIIPFLSWMASKYSLPLLLPRICHLCPPDSTKGLSVKTGFSHRPISSVGRTEHRRQETRVPGSGLDSLTFKMGDILRHQPGGRDWDQMASYAEKKTKGGHLSTPQRVPGRRDRAGVLSKHRAGSPS